MNEQSHLTIEDLQDFSIEDMKRIMRETEDILLRTLLNSTPSKIDLDDPRSIAFDSKQMKLVTAKEIQLLRKTLPKISES